MSDDRGRLGSRLLDGALVILMSAMSLWGAVAILASIWQPLCAAAAICALLGGIAWWILQRFHRW